MKKHASKYYVLLLLTIMFAAPGIAAYVFYQHPSWLGSTRVNKGTLLSPSVELKAFDEKTKWKIVLFNPGQCKKECLEHLNLLARVRLALGRRLYEVDEWLLLDEQSAAQAEEMRPLLKDQDIHVATLSAKDKSVLSSLSGENRIFIANPGQFLILGYNAQVNPDDVYKDMKLLLNTSENKSDTTNAK